MIVKIMNKDKVMNIKVKRILLNLPEKGIMRLITEDNKTIEVSTSDFIDITQIGNRVEGD